MSLHIYTVPHLLNSLLFFFNDTAPTEIYTLSLHDALPISPARTPPTRAPPRNRPSGSRLGPAAPHPGPDEVDRKSTRLNSSHVSISYAVFCLKKKKKKKQYKHVQEQKSDTKKIYYVVFND